MLFILQVSILSEQWMFLRRREMLFSFCIDVLNIFFSLPIGFHPLTLRVKVSAYARHLRVDVPHFTNSNILSFVFWITFLNLNPFTTTSRSKRQLPPIHLRRSDVVYVKSIKISVRGFYIVMWGGMKGLKIPECLLIHTRGYVPEGPRKPRIA